MIRERVWRHHITGIDGNVILFGVNIFNYIWEDTGKMIFAEMNSLIPNEIPVYRVTIHGSTYEFAAEELSNCVWAFYLAED